MTLDEIRKEFSRARLGPLVAMLEGMSLGNVLEYIGKDADKRTAEQIKRGEGEVKHSGFWGGKLSERMKALTEEYNLRAHQYENDRKNLKGEERDQRERELLMIQRTMNACKIAFNLALSIRAVESEDLPNLSYRAKDHDPESQDETVYPFPLVATGPNGTILRSCTHPEIPVDVKIYSLKRWSDGMYAKCARGAKTKELAGLGASADSSF